MRLTFLPFVPLIELVIVVNTAPQHLVCRVVQSLHNNHMQMSIIEVSMCRRLHAYEHFNDTHLHMVVMQTLYNSAY